MSYKDIIKRLKLGVTVSRAAYIVKQYAPELVGRSRVSEHDADRIAAMARAGTGATHIARTVGRSEGVVTSIIRNRVPEYGSIREQIRSERARRAIVLRESGQSSAQIARALGCAPTTVNKIIAAHALHLRRMLRARKWRVIPVEVTEQIGVMRTKGLTYPEIEETLGIARGTVGLVVRRDYPHLAGVRRPPRRNSPRLGDVALIAQVVAARETGITLAAVATEVGCSSSTVYRILTAHASHLRSRRPTVSHEVIKQIGELHGQGHSYRDIAEISQVNVGTVASIIRRHLPS